MKVGIVTGASSGIGREFALRLPEACGLDEIWIVARRKDKLEDVAGQIKKCKPVILNLDITLPKDIQTLKDKLAGDSPDLKVLVNNAGFGHIGRFEECPIERSMKMIDLNLRAVIELTYVCLPFMKPGSLIYQVSSLNAYMPFPNGAVYSATTAAVAAFSHSLNVELKPKGIHVITVSPGPVDTEFMEVATQNAEKSLRGSAKPEDIVDKAIKDCNSGKIISAYGFAVNMNMLISKLLPRKMLMKILPS